LGGGGFGHGKGNEHNSGDDTAKTGHGAHIVD